VVAHPGGVWLVGAETICHQSLGPMLRVEGMHPYMRSVEFVHEIGVKASDASEDVIAELDGEPIELTLDTETGWLQGEARLEEVGWHTIDLRIEGASPEVHRSIVVKRLPDVERSWATDIEPLYQENCASSDCHRSGATDPPDLSTFEAWIERSSDIRTQVVDQKNMPPAANVGPDWGQEQIETISQWLEGGMLP
jgi:hypothetical protein